MNHLSKWTLAGYLAAIFAIGCVSGAVVGWGIAKEGKKPSLKRSAAPTMKTVCEHMRSRLETRLELSPAQLQEIDPVLQETARAMDGIHREAMERIESVIESCNRALEKSLNAEQKAKLKELERERPHFRARDGRHKPPC